MAVCSCSAVVSMTLTLPVERLDGGILEHVVPVVPSKSMFFGKGALNIALKLPPSFVWTESLHSFFFRSYIIGSMVENDVLL